MRHYIFHYLPLLSILLLGGYLFVHFSHFPSYQFLVVLGIVTAYFIWGIVHHAVLKRFSAGVLLEYLLIAGLVVMMFASVLNIRL
jgi:hypothetical protein